MPELINIDNLVERKAIYFYYHVRSLYRVPLCLNYNPNKLAVKCGISPNSVRKYVGILRQLGFAEKRGPHLAFVSHKKLHDPKKSKFIWVERKRDFHTFVLYIQLELIRYNYAQQQFIITGKDPKSNDKATRRVLRKYQKNYSSKYVRDEDLINEVLLSSRSISKMLNVCQFTANNILKVLHKEKLIRLKMNIQKITKEEFNVFKHSVYCFIDREEYFIHKGVKIEFIR